MQVATVPGAPGVLARTPSSPTAKLSATSVTISMTSAHISEQLQLGTVSTVSNAARMALEYISRSTKLDRDEKKTLTRLVAAVDEFAGGAPKLMGEIITIAQVMEMASTTTSPRQTWRQTLKDYLEARNQLHDNSAATIRAETEINIVRIQYLGIQASITSGEVASNKNPSIS